MADTQNLLVELFVEELPPKALKKLGEAFANGLATALQAQGLEARRYALAQRVAGARNRQLASAARGRMVSMLAFSASATAGTEGATAGSGLGATVTALARTLSSVA